MRDHFSAVAKLSFAAGAANALALSAFLTLAGFAAPGAVALGAAVLYFASLSLSRRRRLHAALALAFAKAGRCEVTGADFCLPMLRIAAEKGSGEEENPRWIQADALDLAFRDETFDAASVAFGVPVRRFLSESRVSHEGRSEEADQVRGGCP